MHTLADKVWVDPFYTSVKRLLDIIISGMLIIFLLPLIFIVGLGVFISSEGPVIYVQERMGFKRKKFKIYKFRSMYINAESDGPRLAVKHDKRVTAWGRTMRRWKLDELPQLWNVLAGDMSLVGPRPEREYFINKLEQENLPVDYLLEAKPGLTSLGMIKFGYARSLDEMAERMRYDVQYVDKRSLRLDIEILLRTIGVIFEAKGK